MALLPTLGQIRDAQQILATYFPATPLLRAPSISQPNVEVHLKLETALPTGSFKPRGALYALVKTVRQRKIAEVTASSTGNHGAAVAWAAKTFNIPATIFLPTHPNPVKRKKIADLGARIVEAGGGDPARVFVEAYAYSARPGCYFLNDASDPHLPAGPATIAVELLAQLPNIAAVYVPMGDTALVRGIGAALKQLKPDVAVVGVQAERAPAYYLSWKAGHAVPTETCDTCADGLATRTPEPDNVRAIRELVDDVILVTEEELVAAIGRLYHSEKILAEPAGAAATAAFLKHPPTAGPVVLLVTGANISEEVRLRAGIPKTQAQEV